MIELGARQKFPFVSARELYRELLIWYKRKATIKAVFLCVDAAKAKCEATFILKICKITQYKLSRIQCSWNVDEEA